jgi:hypothetical protein
MVKDGSIGSNGRSVSCARCDTVWFVAGTDPDAMALEDNEAVLITPEPEPQPELPLETGTPASESSASHRSAPAPIGAHVLLRDKADAEKLARRRKVIKLIWAVPLVLLVLMVSLIFIKRQDIVEAYPKAATFYQMFGVNVKANGVDIRGLASERLVFDGEDVLRVTGEVVNLTSKTISAPMLQLRLENRSGEALVDWFVEPGTIAPGETVNIETDYPAPPIDGVELRYRFLPDE